MSLFRSVIVRNWHELLQQEHVLAIYRISEYNRKQIWQVEGEIL